MRFNVLGPIEVELEGKRRRLRSPIQRTLLAMLLVNRDREVSADRIIEALWRDDDLQQGRRRLWFHVSKLREFLEGSGPDGDQVVITGTTGYRIRDDAHRLDSDDFERLVEQGVSLLGPEPRAASDTLEAALGLWRGEPYEDVPADSVGWSESVRLNELRLGAVEARFEAMLRDDRHQSIIPELENAVAEHPFREGLRAQLMRALYVTGRQADALKVYRETKDTLVSQLGIDPSPALQELELKILQQAPSLLPATPAVASSRAGAEIDDRFIGREEPLSILGDALEKAVSGSPQSVFVSGEAGMGKTTLLGEFAQRACSRHADVIIMGARAPRRVGHVSPFGIVRDAFSRLIDGEGDRRAGFGPPPSAAVTRAVIDAVLKVGAGLVGTLIPAGELLDAADRVDRPDAESDIRSYGRVAGGAVALSRPLAEQCSDTIRRLARSATVLILIDDLQGIDSPSLDVLSMVCEPHRTASLLVVGAFRPEDFDTHQQARDVLGFVGRGGLIDLDAGAAAGARSLVDAIIDRDPNHLGEDFREELATRSGGNPLFALELLNSLREQGSVVTDDGVLNEAPGWSWGERTSRIENVLAHRFSRLDPDVLAALKVGSVEGVEFSADLVARTLGASTSMVVEQLSGEASGRHRLVDAIGPIRIGQDRVLRYRFRHQLFQEYAYTLLDEVERPHLHARVATALESLVTGSGDMWLGELARHFEAAAMPAKAISYLIDWATQAIRFGANMEAEHAINHALDLLDGLAPAHERDATELDLQVLLGLARSATRGFSAAEVEHAYRRATDLMLAADNDLSRMPVYFGLWSYYTSRSQFDRAHELSQRMFDLATDSGDDGMRLQALHTRWTESVFRGDPGGALTAVDEARRIYRHAKHHPLSFRYGNHDPGVCSLVLGGLSSALHGEPDRAAQMMAEAEALADALHHPVSRAQARYMTTLVQQIAGDSAAALETAQRALVDLADVKAPIWEGLARAVLAWALSQEGHDAEAIGAVEEATDPDRSLAPDDVFAPVIGCLATHVYLRAGLSDRAELTSRTLENHGANVGEYFYAAEVLRTRAHVLHASGRRLQAVSLVQEALDIADAQEARALAIRAATTLNTMTADHVLVARRLRASLGPLMGRTDVPYVRDAMQILDVK